MIRKRNRWLTIGRTALLAAGLSAVFSLAAMAEPVSDQLTGDTIEYSQLKEWIRQYHPVVKSANESYYVAAEESMKVAEELRDEANDLYDEALDLEKEGTAEAKEAAQNLRENVKTLRKYAKKQQDAAEDMDKSSSRQTLNQTEDTLTYNAQVLVNTYWQLMAQKEMAETNVAAAKAAVEGANAMAGLNMAVESDILTAANGLGSAEASLNALNASIDQVKRNIYILTGQNTAAGKNIGQIPGADLSYLDTVDIEADCTAAIGNNYELRTKRHTELDTKEKTNKKDRSRLLDIEQAEDQVSVTVRSLYDDMFQQKATYEGAKAAYESAAITWRGAEAQYQRNMLSNMEYLQQKAAFQQKEAAFRQADLGLFQSIETYKWAVSGLLVSSSDS